MSIRLARVKGVEFFKSPAIKLSSVSGSAVAKPDVQVLRVGKFSHPKYGEFEITPLTLTEMKANFDNRVRGVDIAFDYFHDSDKDASGWPTELYLSENDTELWAKVDWTPKAQAKLSEREIRYFSPDFAFKWQDPETKKVYNNVLFGGGLTNRPFVKDMAAIVASEGENIMTPEELKALQAQILKLSEGQAKLEGENKAMKAKLAEYADAPPPKAAPTEENPEDDEDDDDVESLKKKLAESKKANAKLMAEAAKSKEAAQLAEKKSKFNILLSEGKACAAQEEAFIKGDTEEFIKLAQPVNLDGKGYTGDPKKKPTGDGDREERVLKLAEEKVSANPKLTLVDAISIANKEIKA